MIKRLLLILLPLCFLLASTVSAQSNTNIEPYGEFFTLTEHKEAVAEIINIPLEELDSFCDKNHIEYIAVNSDNSKQIRITATTTDFSNSVVNISLLSNDKISALIPQITDISGVRGQIIDKNGQKFIKTELRSKDSGGEYILTQYYTVADKKGFTLSFYTDLGQDIEYVEKTFETYKNSSFITATSNKNNLLQILLPIGIIVFATICIIIIITLIIDLRKKR